MNTQMVHPFSFYLGFLLDILLGLFLVELYECRSQIRFPMLAAINKSHHMIQLPTLSGLDFSATEIASTATPVKYAKTHPRRYWAIIIFPYPFLD
jgi:hypothetical protein